MNFCISFQWINCLEIENRLTLIDFTKNILGVGRVKINNTIEKI